MCSIAFTGQALGARACMLHMINHAPMLPGPRWFTPFRNIFPQDVIFYDNGAKTKSSTCHARTLRSSRFEETTRAAYVCDRQCSSLVLWNRYHRLLIWYFLVGILFFDFLANWLLERKMSGTPVRPQRKSGGVSVCLWLRASLRKSSGMFLREI